MKLRRMHLLGLALIALVWLGYAIAGGWLASQFNARWGAKILAAAQGNVSDAGYFLRHRFFDAALLVSIAVALMLAHSLVAGWILNNRGSRYTRWTVHALIGFVAVNLWLAVAVHTALFWACFWQGRYDTAMLARNQFKRLLLRENPIARKAVILGSSQARAQMDEEQLNREFGAQLYTGELHFPGSHAFDIWLVHHHLRPTDAQIILCYVSESTFYDGIGGEAVPFYFGFSDWREASALGATRLVAPRKLGYGLLGDALPAFYLRPALANRILGPGLGGIMQRLHDQTAKADAAGNADRAAAHAQLNDVSDFQKRAFTALAANCARNGQTLVVIAGQLNPRLGGEINPAIRADMLAYLRDLRQRSPGVVLVDDCPPQAESDYDDLTHVNKRMQEEFTRFIAGRLRELLANGAGPK